MSVFQSPRPLGEDLGEGGIKFPPNPAFPQWEKVQNISRSLSGAEGNDGKISGDSTPIEIFLVVETQHVVSLQFVRILDFLD